MNIYDIIFSSSEAAIDIIHHISGEREKINYENISKLADYLKRITEDELNHPQLLTMMGNAIWPELEDQKTKKISELILQTHLFSKELSNFTKLPGERQLELAYACCDLNKSARGIPREYRTSINCLVA